MHFDFKMQFQTFLGFLFHICSGWFWQMQFKYVYCQNDSIVSKTRLRRKYTYLSWWFCWKPTILYLSFWRNSIVKREIFYLLEDWWWPLTCRDSLHTANHCCAKQFWQQMRTGSIRGPSRSTMRAISSDALLLWVCWSRILQTSSTPWMGCTGLSRPQQIQRRRECWLLVGME